MGFKVSYPEAKDIHTTSPDSQLLYNKVIIAIDPLTCDKRGLYGSSSQN
jgi:hypothetical protein